MKKMKERLQGRWFFLLLCLLWGGIMTANAEKKAWAKYDDSAKTLTFYYSDKSDLGENEYEMNTGNNNPGWYGQNPNITKVVFDPSFADARPTSCFGWFYKGANIETIEGIQYLNTSEVESMWYMFCNCSKLTKLDLSHFDTSKVYYMNWMFAGCTSLVELNLSSFNTPKLRGIECMFRYCPALTKVNISSFDTSDVGSMMDMFYGCSSLICLDLSNFDTSHVSTMMSMFSGCKKLVKLDLSSFYTPQVSNMRYMFSNCNSLKEIYASDKFQTSAYTYSDDMFWGCTSLKGDIVYDKNKVDRTYATITDGYFVDRQYVQTWVEYADNTLTFYKGYKKTTISSANGEYELNTAKKEPNWLAKISNVTKVVFDPSFVDARPTSCYYWFKGGENIETIVGIENLNTSNVTDMALMFSGCSKLAQLDLSHFDTSNVTDMCAMFYKCSALSSINLSSFNTANVTKIDQMFRDCSTLSRLDLSSFNTAKVSEFGFTFANCSSLKELNLSHFDTSSLKNMYYMFNGCSSLTKLTLPKKFDTSKATNMQQLFKNCSSLTSLNLPKDFNTSNVQCMTEMFMGCSSLTNLDLSSFNTSEAIKMDGMFRDCTSLTNLDLSSFNTTKVTNMLSMFRGCTSLTSLDLSYFNTQNLMSMGNMFKDCSNLQSLYLGAEFKKVGTSVVIPSDMPTTMYSLPSNYATNKADFSGITVKPYVPINAKSEYGTICVPLGSKLTADSYTGFDKLYTVKAADTAKGTISLAEATSIEPGVAYIYHRDLAADATKSVITFEADDNSTTTVPATDGNLLKGTFERITAPGGSYILQTDGNFHPVALGNTTLSVGAYRAYLSLPGLDNTGDIESNALRMVFGEATGINSVNTNNANLSNIYFDLSGRKVANPQRGSIYINNGRKIVF